MRLAIRPLTSFFDSTFMFDLQRILAAHRRACDDLLAERTDEGHWTGRLSTSALSTATAVSSLAIVEQHTPIATEGRFVDSKRPADLSELIAGGLRWLGDHQNDDGGWGDTDKSYSNIATTMLVVAALHLGGAATRHEGPLEKANNYIDSQGGTAGLRRRFGKDKTFAVPILANCALAGLVDWREVSPLPFELAAVPQSFFRWLRLPVVSYAIPALVAIGQARFFSSQATQSDHQGHSHPIRCKELASTKTNAATERRLSGSGPADEFCGDESGLDRARGARRNTKGRKVSGRFRAIRWQLADRFGPGNLEYNAGDQCVAAKRPDA